MAANYCELYQLAFDHGAYFMIEMYSVGLQILVQQCPDCMLQIPLIIWLSAASGTDVNLVILGAV
jgi:hypothetical protein